MKNKIAGKIIKEMQQAGLTPDEMLQVIKLAKEKYKKMRAGDFKKVKE